MEESNFEEIEKSEHVVDIENSAGHNYNRDSSSTFKFR